MTDTRLLAVVEVPQSDRVVCQAPGCKHPVYRRIHVALQDGALTVLGSACFKRLFGEEHSSPSYGSGEGRLLTQEERQLLVENTARLIAKFEAEHQAAIEKARLAAEKQAVFENAQRAEEQRRQLEADRLSSLGLTVVQPVTGKAARARSKTPTSPLSDQKLQAALFEVKQEYRARGLDPDLPGWRGMVQYEAKKRLR